MKQGDLAEFIRKTMKAKGLTLRDVEERSHGAIHNSYISKILGGVARNPTRDKLAAIAKGLGVPLGEVLRAIGSEPESEAEFQESALYYLYQQRLTATDDVKWLIDETIAMLLDRIEKTRLQPTRTLKEEEKEPLPGRQ